MESNLGLLRLLTASLLAYDIGWGHELVADNRFMGFVVCARLSVSLPSDVGGEGDGVHGVPNKN
jgi:hypothetical protein